VTSPAQLPLFGSSWFHFTTDVVLRAGAGTGKTHALVTLYLHLVGGLTSRREPLTPSQIVALSFTEKAAAELADKIRARMHRLAEGAFAEEEALSRTAAALGVPPPPPALWERAIHQLGGAPVGTFHRLGGLLLRRHAVAAGIDPAARQLDEVEAAERLAGCVERLVLAALERREPGVEELVAELGFSAHGRVAGLVGVLCRLLARRVEEAGGGPPLDEGYRAARLAAEYPPARAAFLDTAERVAALKALGPRGREIAASLGARLPVLRPRLEDPAEAALPSLIDDLDELLEAVGDLRGTRANPGADDERRAFVESGNRLVEQLRSRRAAPLVATLARLEAEAARRYRDEKRRLGALDFADLIAGARDLLRDHPSVRRAEQARIEAILVDEFQDTNAAQSELLRLLAGEPRGHGRLLVVGDRKQSIYEFRGADVGVFVEFERAQLDAGGRGDALRRSFRSRPSLVELANALFARAFRGSGERWDLRWDAQTDPLLPERAPADAVCVELLTVEGDDAESRRAAESRAIAVRLAALRAERADGKPQTMALLLRAFTHVEDYLDALRRAGVPHYVVNGRGFFEAQEVRDLAAALQLLDDPDDRLALVTVLRSPLVLLSDETLLRLSFARQLRLAALLEGEHDGLDAGEAERLARFTGAFRSLRRRADRLGPGAVLRVLLDETGLEVVLAAGFQGEQRVANLARLVERAREMEEAGGDLRGFVRWLGRLTEPGAEGADRQGAQAPIVGERDDVVRVMTVHQAKGLEFDVVAVGACGVPEPPEVGPVYYDSIEGLGLKLRVRGELRHTAASWRVAQQRQARAAAESVRLFYVAVTRAKERLLLAGESQRNTTTWRALLDEALADPEVRRRVATVEAARLVPPVPPRPPPMIPPGDPARAAALVERLVLARQHACTITIAVTQLADFALCPRRYHFFHEVGMAEHPRAARPPSPDTVDPELDPLARGTLAHHLLEHADFAAGGADLDGLLAAAGYDPSVPEVGEVREHVRALLTTSFVRELGASAADDVRRELPFLLAVRAPRGVALRLRGQIDLLVRDGGGDRVTVVDYKHARAGSDADYRFQLAAYALAARRLFPDARRVRVGLAYLREADPTPRFHELDEADGRRFEEELGALADQLADAVARAPGDGWEGRAEATCRAIGCGYLYRCHPR
jgi:ATP-dependent exoDNAse (exonuclease V) beta subunit